MRTMLRRVGPSAKQKVYVALMWSTPFLCALALVLCVLSITAGLKADFMTDYAIITLNTSGIGPSIAQKISQEICGQGLRRRDILTSVRSAFTEVTVVPSVAETIVPNRHSVESLVSSRTRSLKSEITSAVTSAESAVATDVTQLCSQIAHGAGSELGDVLKLIGLQAWYSLHVLDFCEGSYAPETATGTTLTEHAGSRQQVVACATPSPKMGFNFQSILTSQINHTTGGRVDLADLGWPATLSQSFDGLRDAPEVMVTLYGVSAALITLALMISIGAIASRRKAVVIACTLMYVLACLVIGFTALFVTALATRVSHAVNEFGEDVGIRAIIGSQFIVMTWSIALPVLLGAMFWKMARDHLELGS